MISDSWQVGWESKYGTVLHIIAVDKIWLCGNNADTRFAVVVVRWFVAVLCDFFLFGLAWFVFCLMQSSSATRVSQENISFSGQ